MFVPVSRVKGLVHDTSRIIFNWFSNLFALFEADVARGTFRLCLDRLDVRDERKSA